MGINRRVIGEQGEDLAVKALKECGYKILERNFRCRFGEIDIIARDEETTVFIEVKARNNNKFGLAEEAVDYRKQQKIRQVAEFYLLINDNPARDCRFDVCCVSFKEKEGPGVKILKNCF